MANTSLKSSNGWPASKDPAEIGIKSYKIPGTDIKIRVAEKVAPLLVGLAAEFHKEIEAIDKGPLDDWAFNFRMRTETCPRRAMMSKPAFASSATTSS